MKKSFYFFALLLITHNTFSMQTTSNELITFKSHLWGELPKDIRRTTIEYLFQEIDSIHLGLMADLGFEKIRIIFKKTNEYAQLYPIHNFQKMHELSLIDSPAINLPLSAYIHLSEKECKFLSLLTKQQEMHRIEMPFTPLVISLQEKKYTFFKDTMNRHASTVTKIILPDTTIQKNPGLKDILKVLYNNRHEIITLSHWNTNDSTDLYNSIFFSLLGIMNIYSKLVNEKLVSRKDAAYKSFGFSALIATLCVGYKIHRVLYTLCLSKHQITFNRKDNSTTVA